MTKPAPQTTYTWIPQRSPKSR